MSVIRNVINLKYVIKIILTAFNKINVVSLCYFYFSLMTFQQFMYSSAHMRRKENCRKNRVEQPS